MKYSILFLNVLFIGILHQLTFAGSPGVGPRYWVGGSGTWNASSTSNWSYSSGGVSGATAPTITNDVIFDSLSTPDYADGYTVTVAGSVHCKSIIMKSYPNHPGAALSMQSDPNPIIDTITVAGSAFLSPYGYELDSYVANFLFTGSGTDTIIANEGAYNSNSSFNGSGSWHIQKYMFNANSIYLYKGSIYVEDTALGISCSTFKFLGAGTKAIHFDPENNIVNAYTLWDVTGSSGSTTIDGNYTINNYGVFKSGNLSYNSIICNYGSSIYSGNSSFNQVQLQGGSKLTISAPDTFKVQNFSTLYNSSSALDSITSNNSNTAYILDANAGKNCLNYMNITHVNAIGTSSFYLYNSSITAGTGWTNVGNNFPSASIGSSVLLYRPICAGSTFTLSPVPVSALIHYSWTSTSGSIHSSADSIGVTATQADNFYLTATDNASGCFSTDSVSVGVVALPSVYVSPNIILCPGGSTSLTGYSTAPTVYEYVWAPANAIASGSPFIYNPGSALTVTAVPAATTTYTFTATSMFNDKDFGNIYCSNSAYAVVTVDTYSINAVSPAIAICDGSSTSLSATGAFLYNWTPSTGLSGTFGATIIADPATTTTYSVTGCFNTQTVVVTVKSIPVVNAGSGVSICLGSAVTLNASGADLYAWTPGNGLNTVTGSSPTASPTASVFYKVTGTVNGCSDKDSVLVTIIPAQINGNVVYSGGVVKSNTSKTFAKLFSYAVNRQMKQVDSVSLDVNGHYIFNNISVADSFVVFVKADTSTYPNTVGTYYADAFEWTSATTIKPACPTISANITLIETQTSASGGTVTGKVIEGLGFGKTEAAGDGIGGVEVGLKKKPGGQLVVSTTTSSNGNYSFSNVPAGSQYTVYVDIPGLPVVSTYTIDYSVSASNLNNINFEADSNQVAAISATFIQPLSNNPVEFTVYPNPAKQSAVLSWQSTGSNNVVITLYDIVGREIKLIGNQSMNAGNHFTNVNLSDVSPGVYFIKLQVDNAVYTQRLVRIE